MFSPSVVIEDEEKQPGRIEEAVDFAAEECVSDEKDEICTPTAIELADNVGNRHGVVKKSDEKVTPTLSSSITKELNPTSAAKSDDEKPKVEENGKEKSNDKGEEETEGAVPTAKSVPTAKLIMHPLNGTMHDLPDLNDEKLRHNFELDVSNNVDVTCMDISCHGCHVLVGCSNGMVLIFNMASTSQKGVVLGQIKAKGLHTNLLLTVKIADDARFAFAGVMKGSMEMLAVDLGKVPVWPEKIRRSNASLKDLITVHSHSDPKLRGLGAAVRVIDNSSDSFQYRLVCGKGIKNVHVWSFFPDCVDGPRWTCLYDVASNGNTIETMAFRRCGEEILSKSSHMGVRLWRMNSEDTSNATAAATGKLAFEDVPNTQDARVMLEDYVFGGTYNFAAVKIGASKTLNRSEFEVPERTTEDDNGQRRKRQMRLIEDVISTQDGKQALALCSDGGVLYFRNEYVEVKEQTSEEKSSMISDAINCSLVEFNSIQRNPSDGAWAIRRVGKRGTVVLLRSQILETEAGGSKTSISVNLLSAEASGEVSETKLPVGARSWSLCGYYNEKDPFVDTVVEVEETTATSTSKPNNRKKSPKMVTPASAIITAKGGSNNNNKNISPTDNLMQIADSGVGTPIMKDASDSRKNIIASRCRADSSTANRKRKVPISDSNSSTENNYAHPIQSQTSLPTWKFVEKPEKPLETKYFTLPPIMRIPFVKESFEVIPLQRLGGGNEMEAFKRLKEKYLAQWLDLCDPKSSLVDDLDEWAIESRCVQTIKQVMVEQDRIMCQFTNDIVRSLDGCVSNYIENRCLKNFIRDARMKQNTILSEFVDGVSRCLQVRQLELASAVACDRMNCSEGNIRSLLVEAGKQSGVVEVQTSVQDYVLGPNIVFKYRNMFEAAKEFLIHVEEAINVTSH